MLGTPDSMVLPLRVGLFKAGEHCFVTFDSDNLDIPLLNGVTAYNIFYTPNTGDGEWAISEIERGW